MSRFGDDKEYWKESAKMLAIPIHLLRGISYIFQGEELGVTNAGFKDINEYWNVESISYCEIIQSGDRTRKGALDILTAYSHGNRRTPMRRDGTKQAEFTDSVPWIDIPANRVTINAEAGMADESSIWDYHRKLIALRKGYEVIASGRIELLFQSMPDLFAYSWFGVGEEVLVFNNLNGWELVLPETVSLRGCNRLIGNYEDGHGESLVAL